MRDLVELVNLINRTKLKSNELMKAVIEPGSKMERLFDGLLDKTVQEDDDVKILFRGEEDINVTSLKNKLKEGLQRLRYSSEMPKLSVLTSLSACSGIPVISSLPN
jgi:hypothetical protein